MGDNIYLRDWEGHVPVELIGNQTFPRIGAGPYFFSMAPHSFFWFRLDPPADRAG